MDYQGALAALDDSVVRSPQETSNAPERPHPVQE
jgi:hypothetical protein